MQTIAICKISLSELVNIFFERKNDKTIDVKITNPHIVINPRSFPLSKFIEIIAQTQIKRIELDRKIKFSLNPKYFISVLSFIPIAHNGSGLCEGED